MGQGLGNWQGIGLLNIGYFAQVLSVAP